MNVRKDKPAWQAMYQRQKQIQRVSSLQERPKETKMTRQKLIKSVRNDKLTVQK